MHSETPYWYSKVTKQSYWDSPFSVLGALVASNVESELKHTVADYSPLMTKSGADTGYLKIKMTATSMYMKRGSEQVSVDNPIKKKQVQ